MNIDPSAPYAALRILSQSRNRKAGNSPVLPSAKPKASAAPAPPRQPAAAVSVGHSQAALDQAIAKARSEERARFAAVFASDASKGRERACVTLLSAPQNWSASAIVAELPHLPKDADLAADAARKKQAEIAASWDRVYDAVFAGRN